MGNHVTSSKNIMGNHVTSSNYDSKSSIIDNIMNTDNLKLNKILQIKYNNNILDELTKLLENFNINTCNKEGKNLLHIFVIVIVPSDIKILKIILDKGSKQLNQTIIFVYIYYYW